MCSGCQLRGKFDAKELRQPCSRCLARIWLRLVEIKLLPFHGGQFRCAWHAELVPIRRAVALWTLLAASLVINFGYALYIYPVYHGMGNTTLVGLYSDASTFAGYLIMTILSPCLSIVYATSK